MSTLPRFDIMHSFIDGIRIKYDSDKRFLNAVKNSYHGRDSFYSKHAMNYASTLLKNGECK